MASEKGLPAEHAVYLAPFSSYCPSYLGNSSSPVRVNLICLTAHSQVQMAYQTTQVPRADINGIGAGWLNMSLEAMLLCSCPNY